MLIFPLKKQWYEKIKSGEKTIEYREVKPYWCKRFASELNYFSYKPYTDSTMPPPERLIGMSRNFDKLTCKLRLGYTNQYMTADIRKVEIVDGKNTDLHIDKPVYAIHLSNIKESV